MADKEIINAEFIEGGDLPVDTVIYLTGGLVARAAPGTKDGLCLYPKLQDGLVTFSKPISEANFLGYLSSLSVEVIGVKENSNLNGQQHWRWAPSIKRGPPPQNNPSYRWSQVAQAIEQNKRMGKNIVRPQWSMHNNDLGDYYTEAEMQALATQARYVSISLHQMNWAMATIADHFHKELCGALSSGQADSKRFATIRDHDLFSYFHSLFQAFGTARDHYAHFLAHQIGKTEGKGKKGSYVIDSLANLFRAFGPDEIGSIKMINLLERRSLIERKKDSFTVVRQTWLGYSNFLRNRFIHKCPLGMMPKEDISEIYKSNSDTAYILLKRYLNSSGEDDAGPDHCDLLRTINGLYQSISYLFWDAAEMTGFEPRPPQIVVV